ncbi:methyltransferase domain-containing protein [Candidatus Fermentibacteria bacterium]|nr:methyltransferase domain-containing protein [Candidatus Fermentibacteria bacterium]
MTSTVEWSRGSRRAHIEKDRQFLWREDTVALIARWVGLKPGMKVADVGCGLGYLGWTYWEFFGCGGSYLGLDLSVDLVCQAAESSRRWALQGQARFAAADAYHLPLPSGQVDCTMCQTTLMHVERPSEVMAEMVRITRPGGIVLCKEPDNLGSWARRTHSSLPPQTLREQMWAGRMGSIYAEGRRRLGRGDMGIGTKVPKMMADLGLVDIDARANDLVFLVLPPYKSSRERFWIHRAQERLQDDRAMQEWERDFKECFLAGGGSRSACDRYLRHCREQRGVTAELHRTQVEDGSYFACSALGGAFFCVRGVKPAP